jgi:hypothetical protein
MKNLYSKGQKLLSVWNSCVILSEILNEIKGLLIKEIKIRYN